MRGWGLGTRLAFPLRFYTGSDQKLEAGTAWERGYINANRRTKNGVGLGSGSIRERGYPCVTLHTRWPASAQRPGARTCTIRREEDLRNCATVRTIRNSMTPFIAMAERGEFDVLVRLTSWDGDHLQGSWTVLPHGTSSQDHCDYLSLQRSLWLKDDDTPGTMPAYEFFSRFLAWMYLGRLAEVAGRRGNRILTGPRKILLDLLEFWNRSKKDWWSEEKRFFETCWCIPTDTGTKIQFMKLAQDKAGNN